MQVVTRVAAAAGLPPGYPPIPGYRGGWRALTVAGIAKIAAEQVAPGIPKRVTCVT